MDGGKQPCHRVAGRDTTTRSASASQALAANVFRISRVGTEAVLEGYYASPADLAAVANPSSQAKRVDLEPVCNIPMGLPVMVGLLSRLKEVVGG